MKSLVKMLLSLVVVGLITSCGGSATTSSFGVTSLDELPMATGPMAEPATGNISADVAAAEGLNFLTASADDFDHTDSQAMCETFNVARDAIVSAAQADTILCYVQNMSSLISDITDNDGHPIDVYDGEWHIFNLNITGAGDGSPDKVKMQIIREGENITSFKMFMCVRDGEGLIQNEYTEQLLDGDGLSMTAKGRYRDEWAGTHEVNVTGEFDDDGAYTQKTIETKNSGSEIGNEENTNWQEVTFTQTPGEFTVSGYQRGNHTDQGGSGTYQQAAYGVGQMLGDASPVIANLAMGNGAVNVDSAYTWDNDEHGQGGEDFPSEVFAWLGDTLA